MVTFCKELQPIKLQHDNLITRSWRSCDKFNILYLHLQKTYGHQTRWGVDLVWQASILKATWTYDHETNVRPPDTWHQPETTWKTYLVVALSLVYCFFGQPPLIFIFILTDHWKYYSGPYLFGDWKYCSCLHLFWSLFHKLLKPTLTLAMSNTLKSNLVSRMTWKS